MDPIIQRKAEELGQLLAESSTLERLQNAKEALLERSAAQLMLRDFAQKQQRLQQKSLAGQEITDAEKADLQRAWQMVSMNPYVREYMEAEQEFGDMWLGVMSILSQAVGLEAPEDEDEGEQEGSEVETDDEPPRQTKSRLWVPGQ